VGELAEDHGSRCVTVGLLQVARSHHNVGGLLLKRLLIAIPQAIQTRFDFKTFDKSLRQEMPAEVHKMEKVLAAWVNDKSCPDPYRIPKSSG
jgi:hypothetical protein